MLLHCMGLMLQGLTSVGKPKPPCSPTCTMPMSLQMSVMRLWLQASATSTRSPACMDGGKASKGGRLVHGGSMLKCTAKLWSTHRQRLQYHLPLG